MKCGGGTLWWYRPVLVGSVDRNIALGQRIYAHCPCQVCDWRIFHSSSPFSSFCFVVFSTHWKRPVTEVSYMVDAFLFPFFPPEVGKCFRAFGMCRRRESGCFCPTSDALPFIYLPVHFMNASVYSSSHLLKFSREARFRVLASWRALLQSCASFLNLFLSQFYTDSGVPLMFSFVSS